MQFILDTIVYIVVIIVILLLILGVALFSFLLFSGALVYVVVFSIITLLVYFIFHRFINNSWKSLVWTVVFYIVAALSYSFYIFSNPPTQQSFFENGKVCRLATYIGANYSHGLSPFTYRSLAYHYRVDLKNNTQKLTSIEQETLWENYVRNYKEKQQNEK